MIKPYYDKKHSTTLTLFSKAGFAEDWELERCSETEGIQMRDLPPFLRTLLITDGTVTKHLEAYFWEPVNVKPLAQSLKQTESEIPWLHLQADETVLTREVELVGEQSKHHYATAFSIVCPTLIPAPFRQALLDGEIGIGKLIRESGMESYREVLEIGVTDSPLSKGSEQSQAHVYRTYRILLAGKAAILITERFPLAIFSS